MKCRIAFLGTGLMGAPMAGRLLDAGFDVTVWNRNSAKSAPLVEKGAKLAQTAAKAGVDADIVITMLTDGPAVRDVLFEQGVAAVLKKGSIVIDMSSISPDFAREHSKRLEATGVNHIDAPVSGGVVGAQEGTLAIMAGGDEAVIATLADVFKPLGRLTRVGPSGAGQLAKLANQQIVAVTIGAIAEAMVLVEKGGGSRAAFRDAIRGGFCESRILELHGKRMIDRNFKPGGTSRIQLKDLNSILKTAGDLSLKLPLTETVREAFATFVEDGGGEKDHSALLLHIEKLNDVPQD
ncbi:NAD(P)-dependent oxidoreductase [Brucella intermedia]|uniref:2-hydroxy-3-oxopropionate reductase n=4 Tax=Brucella/Ochrobactrum group TaxID=2826938 RepID=C4WLX8_9HYPH|nr:MULTISPECIES: NAD(P)-dependent oxidoreductase [Brucella/Ochrobactrum group]ERI13322.1 2-hydroxy-3-oxopropionate reductase [Ochrobactrum sp. EGD-AQ16]PJT22891.1 NAD(P)-dependent oxidoreductase [Ochrobactrum sp. 30A/1000/2015]PJT37753.1 NAD(P)-dependent oxidoreductase [Ochrobactrum sp. 27A/999/2015]PJT42599.1 NAD(P)-dependent oxidoreductase [Ochrobactrum sp. 23A/997/2015]BBA73055.1 2-hydroxy-3-oxopropionate reductase [Ochrobactrum sp. PW1]